MRNYSNSATTKKPKSNKVKDEIVDYQKLLPLMVCRFGLSGRWCAEVPDFDSIWRIQDEIRTVVNAVLGESIWNLAYDERRRAIVLELTTTLDEAAASNLCCQFPMPADNDGEGSKGSKFVFYL